MMRVEPREEDPKVNIVVWSAMMTDEDKEIEEFVKNLLEAMQDLSKDIKYMRIDQMRESLGRFH